ncbi:hypothetical protein LCGC14_1301640 [marine sediment metagenome]|uniref:Uncharacterized protein n=1 Tax=marine sediment metagenome TaxID=412755 RepID=A0A0F9NSB2_9ZZZZ
MKWINSTKLAEKRFNIKRNFTVFNYIDENGAPFGGILVTKDKITWNARNSHGTANSVSQAKSAVEKLARLAAK